MANDGSSLKPFFEPKRVAIIGASAAPGKAGHELLRNIQANGYPGRLHPVNPKGGEILGLPVSTSIGTLPDGVDLALIVLPAEATPQAVRDCAARGIRHVVCMAGGFPEVDETGGRIQRELQDIVRETGIRLMGPNIGAAIPALMLTREIGMPAFDVLLDLRAKYPQKPILVTFREDKDCMEQCKASLEPRGVPTLFGRVPHGRPRLHGTRCSTAAP